MPHFPRCERTQHKIIIAESGSSPPLDRSQQVHLMHRTAQARTAQSGHTIPPKDAAVRPVEAAVRCRCKTERTANLRIADVAVLRCGCANGCYRHLEVSKLLTALFFGEFREHFSAAFQLGNRNKLVSLMRLLD